MLIAFHRQAEKWDLGVHRLNQLKPGRFRKNELQLRKERSESAKQLVGNQVGMLLPIYAQLYFEGKRQCFPRVALSSYQLRCSHISDAAER